MNQAAQYVHADAPFTRELERLRLLEARYDSITARRLRIAGPLAGARCLDVGAGAGSVTRMLAAAVGPSGSVVATDADPRFLVDLDAANVEVRRHDILTDELESSAYDLVHCRALLLHLSDPERALARMAAALRPGGWLLVEDADYSSVGAAEPGHAAAAHFDRVARASRADHTPRPMDLFFGRRLPGLVRALGLVDVGQEALAFRHSGGSVEAQLFAHSVERVRPELLRSGIATEEELAGVLAALADPTFSFTDALNVGVWGRRPAPGFLG